MFVTHNRRKRAAIAKVVMIATLAVVLFTPRMETMDLEPLARFLPFSTDTQAEHLKVALR